MTVSQYLGQDSSSKGQKKGGNVFDRLTDSSTYNSTHKHRFDADGRGALVNSARAVISADHRPEMHAGLQPQQWQTAVERDYRQTIDQLAAVTPAGQLHPPTT